MQRLWMEKTFRFSQRLRFSDVEPSESFQRITLYVRLCAGGQVERNDGELAAPPFVLHQSEEGGRDNMYASESEFAVFSFLIVKSFRLHLAGGLVDPAMQLVVVVKQEIA